MVPLDPQLGPRDQFYKRNPFFPSNQQQLVGQRRYVGNWKETELFPWTRVTTFASTTTRSSVKKSVGEGCVFTRTTRLKAPTLLTTPLLHKFCSHPPDICIWSNLTRSTATQQSRLAYQTTTQRNGVLSTFLGLLGSKPDLFGGTKCTLYWSRTGVSI